MTTFAVLFQFRSNDSEVNMRSIPLSLARLRSDMEIAIGLN